MCQSRVQTDQYLDPMQDLGLSLDPMTNDRTLYAAGNPINMIDEDGHAPAAAACVVTGPVLPECAVVVTVVQGAVFVGGALWCVWKCPKPNFNGGSGVTITPSSTPNYFDVNNAANLVFSQTVGNALKGKKGSIKNAPLPAGAPSWGEIKDLPLAEIDRRAKAGKPGYKAIKKLLTDKRFNKPSKGKKPKK